MSDSIKNSLKNSSHRSTDESLSDATDATEDLNNRIAESLSATDFHVEKDFLSPSEVSNLVEDFSLKRQQGLFKRAGVGQNQTHQLNEDIRRDETLWFEPTSLSQAQEVVWLKLESLRHSLNRRLFLGLQDIEGHYAFYPPGGFYLRHLDRFRADDARTVSVVLYLNQEWAPGDGGELKLFLTENEVAETSPGSATERVLLVEPRAGTLVTFLSDRVPHEVTPANIDRRSFAGWFRKIGDRDRT